jgi:hypothetical protein
VWCFRHITKFNVLLTVFPDTIITSLYQLDAQFFISNTSITYLTFLYMFRTLLCSSSGGQIVYTCIWFHHSGNTLGVQITKICSLLNLYEFYFFLVFITTQKTAYLSNFDHSLVSRVMKPDAAINNLTS